MWKTNPLVLISTILLALILLVVSAGALSAGYSMIVDPDGSGLGMTASWLKNSPFTGFRIPGMILFLFNGILPLLTLIGLFSSGKNNWFGRLNIFPEQHWSLSFSLYCGIIFIIWIIVQQAMTDYFWLQPVITAAGLLIIILSLLPWMKKAYRTRPED